MEPSSKRTYRTAVVLALVIQALHVLSVPLVIPYDGQLYVQLSHLFGKPAFWAQWDYLRTPLFPLALRGAFELLGEHALAVLALQAALGFATILLLGAVVRRLAGSRVASWALVLTALYPTSIAYQHALLSETGIALFLAALVFALTWDPAPRWRAAKPAALLAVLVAGFYFRPSLLYLAPVVCVVDAWDTLRAKARRLGVPLRRALTPGFGRLGVRILVVGLVPFALAAPWQRLDRANRLDAAMLCVGTLGQAVPPRNDPLLGAVAEEYGRLLDAAEASGGLPPSGLGVPAAQLCWRTPGPERHMFLRAALRHPGRYLAGLGRMALLFGNWPSPENDNAVFLHWALNSEGTFVLPGPTPELQESIQRDFAQATDRAPMATLLRWVAPAYEWLVRIAVLAAVLAFLVALVRGALPWLGVTAVPLAFLAQHALVLAPVDRYAFPAYPLLLALVPAAAVVVTRAARSARRADLPPADPAGRADLEGDPP